MPLLVLSGVLSGALSGALSGVLFASGFMRGGALARSLPARNVIGIVIGPPRTTGCIVCMPASSPATDSRNARRHRCLGFPRVADSTKDARITTARGRGCFSGASDDFSCTSSVRLSRSEDEARLLRKERLHHHLKELAVDAESLADAAFRSVTTTDGFDRRFGKSAIKAYRSFVDPRPSRLDAIAREDPDVAANRYARQIDFLTKKHRSRDAEWVRHVDTAELRQTFPLVLVLDNVRSAANVGSIYRSADACGCLEVLTTGITPHPGGNGAEKLGKSALGAERVVSSRHFPTTAHALEFLRRERPNYKLIGMETTERSKCYTDIQYPGPHSMSDSDGSEDLTTATGVALFLGNEVSGVDTEIIPLLDECVEIPMFGTKNSLNVAACAPVAMYEILRQWGVA